ASRSSSNNSPPSRARSRSATAADRCWAMALATRLLLEGDMADNGKIDVDGLPARPAGNLDSIVGVDKATRQAAQFPVTALPMPQGVESALRRQNQEMADLRGALGSGISPYATRAELPTPPSPGQ